MSKTDDKTKWMQFLIEDDDLFKKYSDIWNNYYKNQQYYYKKNTSTKKKKNKK